MSANVLKAINRATGNPILAAILPELVSYGFSLVTETVERQNAKRLALERKAKRIAVKEANHKLAELKGKK